MKREQARMSRVIRSIVPVVFIGQSSFLRPWVPSRQGVDRNSPRRLGWGRPPNRTPSPVNRIRASTRQRTTTRFSAIRSGHLPPFAAQRRFRIPTTNRVWKSGKLPQGNGLSLPSPDKTTAQLHESGLLGLQPARPGRPRQRRQSAHGLVARPDRGQPGRDAAGLRRSAVHAQSRGRHPGHRRRDRRSRVGVPPRQSGGRHGVRRQSHDESEHRDLRPAHHRHQRRQPRLRPRRRDRPARLGDADPRLHDEPGPPFVRAHHRWRQGGLGTKLHAARRPRGLRHHRPRRDDRRGGLAAAYRPGPGRAGRRDLGRHPLRGARARRILDGAELRPGTEPGLRRHVGHLSRAEVHARGRREPAPVPQLHAGPRRRHRRDFLLLPAPERSLGPRSSLRAHPRRHGGGARSGGREVDQPTADARRDASTGPPASSSGQGRR